MTSECGSGWKEVVGKAQRWRPWAWAAAGPGSCHQYPLPGGTRYPPPTPGVRADRRRQARSWGAAAWLATYKGTCWLLADCLLSPTDATSACWLLTGCLLAACRRSRRLVSLCDPVTPPPPRARRLLVRRKICTFGPAGKKKQSPAEKKKRLIRWLLAIGYWPLASG
jgi:hypothetical protein